MQTGSGGRGKGKYLAEINVTPLVDVMLVLLIIFMVTAPMMTRGLEVNLPETKAKGLPQKKGPLSISVNRRGEIFMEDTMVRPDDLGIRLGQLKKNGRVSQVLLKADKDVNYGRVAEVMTLIRESGITSIGLVTRPITEK